MAKKMFHFIVLIRALAAMIITNAHYTGVYPTNLIANGGLLGDVCFLPSPVSVWQAQMAALGNGI